MVSQQQKIGNTLTKHLSIILFYGVALMLPACSGQSKEELAQEQREAGIALPKDMPETDSNVQDWELSFEGQEPVKIIEDCNIRVYENGVIEGPLDVSLVNDIACVTLRLEVSWNYEVKSAPGGYIMLTELVDSGTGIHIWKPHFFDKETLVERRNAVESPIEFLHYHLSQGKLDDTIWVDFGDESYDIDRWYDKERDMEGFLYYGDTVEYLIESGNLVCRVGLAQGIYDYWGEVVIPYLYEDGIFVIDKANATINKYPL